MSFPVIFVVVSPKRLMKICIGTFGSKYSHRGSFFAKKFLKFRDYSNIFNVCRAENTMNNYNLLWKHMSNENKNRNIAPFSVSAYCDGNTLLYFNCMLHD